MAIVTTLVNAEPVLDSFIRYHLANGFYRLFLFFDDPRDVAIDRARRYSRVEVQVHDANLRERWRSTSLHVDRQFAALIDREVMVRQLLNVEVAIQLAIEQDIDWLLHIDVDELYFSPGQPVVEHFRRLDDAGIDYMTYLNYEAVPEEVEIDDYFREVTLFKQNPHAIVPNAASRGLEWLNPRQKAVLGTVPEVARQFFLYYRNGKSAARLREDLLPKGVHEFRRAADELHANISSNPAILHYACCGFEHFWRKYRTLGPIADTWFGKSDITACIGPFHLAARDVVMTGDKAAAKDFYRRRVMIKDADTVQDLIDCGLLLRIPAPTRLLQSISASRSAPGRP